MAEVEKAGLGWTLGLLRGGGLIIARFIHAGGMWPDVVNGSFSLCSNVYLYNTYVGIDFSTLFSGFRVVKDHVAGVWSSHTVREGLAQATTTAQHE